MSIRAIIIFMLIAFALTAIPAALLHAQSSFGSKSNGSIGQPTMAVLKNGQVIHGHVIRESKQTIVVAKSGIRMVFDNSRVEFVCHSFEEAYWQKNARTKATDSTGHKSLFQWCMKNDLLKQARNQIDLLQVMDIKATELEYLNRQLLVAFDRRKRVHRHSMEKIARQRRLLNDSKLASQNKEPDRIENVLADSMQTNPKSSTAEKIRLVSFDNEELVSNPKRSKIATLKELKRTGKSLPPNAVAMFKRKIEPAIVRECFSCHNRQDQPMRLMRLSKNQMIPKRMSQRNLHSMMQYVDYDEPLRSELFKAAIFPHANLSEPIIDEKSKVFKNLGQWLIMVSSRPNQAHEIPDFSIEAAEPLVTAERLPSQRHGASPESTLDAEISFDAGKTKSAANVPLIPDLKTGPKKTLQARDPFDAKIFNEKYSTSRDEK